MQLLANKRVLIVDDDEDTRGAMAVCLHGVPWRTEFARHGHEALRMYTAAHDEGRPYDLLVLDVSLPELSGLAVLADIRAGGDTQTQAVMHTAYSSDSTLRMRASMAGAADIWRKPESIRDLPELIARQLAAHDGRPLPGVLTYPPDKECE